MTSTAIRAAAPALAILLAASAAAAAGPAGQMGDHRASLKTSLIQVDYQQCWWRSGRQYCRWVSDEESDPPRIRRYRNSSEDVGSRRPEEFETGSREWWQAMDRQGRGGFGRP